MCCHVSGRRRQTMASYLQRRHLEGKLLTSPKCLARSCCVTRTPTKLYALSIPPRFCCSRQVFTGPRSRDQDCLLKAMATSRYCTYRSHCCGPPNTRSAMSPSPISFRTRLTSIMARGDTRAFSMRWRVRRTFYFQGPRSTSPGAFTHS